MNHRLKYYGPTLFWAILIFILSSIPSLKQPDMGFSMQDKLAHAAEFGIFGFLLQRSFSHAYGRYFKIFMIVLIVGIGYAGLDEIHQSFVRGRICSFRDFFADSIGMIIGQALFLDKIVK